MKGSYFVFKSVDLLYYSLHKISLNSSGSYIDSPKWLKHKAATINSKNEDKECFKYAITVAFNLEKIKKCHQRISKIKPFIDQYKRKRIEVSSHSKDWKKFKQKNKTIALNILFIPYNTEKIQIAYKSKYNHKRDSQVILLMITNGKKLHYLTVKILSTLLKGITSNHKGDFYCLNCLYSYRTKEKLKKYENV